MQKAVKRFFAGFLAAVFELVSLHGLFSAYVLCYGRSDAGMTPEQMSLYAVIAGVQFVAAGAVGVLCALWYSRQLWEARRDADVVSTMGSEE